MSKAREIQDDLNVLEAQRLVTTIELRNDLITAAAELLPEAIRQAKPHAKGKNNRPGPPALPRLIGRLAMPPTKIARPKKKKKKEPAKKKKEVRPCTATPSPPRMASAPPSKQ